eukprot:6971361-Ditylum_brightwellii.AAC.1
MQSFYLNSSAWKGCYKIKFRHHQQKTAPIIGKIIIYKLSQHMSQPVPPIPQIPYDTLGDTLWMAIEKHHKIGWDNFLKGRISTSWGTAQAIFHSKVHRNNKSLSHDSWMP